MEVIVFGLDFVAKHYCTFSLSDPISPDLISSGDKSKHANKQILISDSKKTSSIVERCLGSSDCQTIHDTLINE